MIITTLWMFQSFFAADHDPQIDLLDDTDPGPAKDDTLLPTTALVAAKRIALGDLRWPDRRWQCRARFSDCFCIFLHMVSWSYRSYNHNVKFASMLYSFSGWFTWFKTFRHASDYLNLVYVNLLYEILHCARGTKEAEQATAAHWSHACLGSWCHTPIFWAVTGRTILSHTNMLEIFPFIDAVRHVHSISFLQRSSWSGPWITAPSYDGGLWNLNSPDTSKPLDVLGRELKRGPRFDRSTLCDAVFHPVRTTVLIVLFPDGTFIQFISW